jgi:hypothetical protein
VRQTARGDTAPRTSSQEAVVDAANGMIRLHRDDLCANGAVALILRRAGVCECFGDMRRLERDPQGIP